MKKIILLILIICSTQLFGQKKEAGGISLSEKKDTGITVKCVLTDTTLFLSVADIESTFFQSLKRKVESKDKSVFVQLDVAQFELLLSLFYESIKQAAQRWTAGKNKK